MESPPVALVTGCSTGIGREAVGQLAEAGFLVVATARQAADIADLAAPGRVETEVLDVTKAADRKRVVAAVLRRHGRIDALVNNAGWGVVAAAEETTPELMQRIFDTNLFGLHELTRLVLPAMREAGRGRVVNVSSLSGHIAVPMMSAYCATKFALRALTLAMDVEVRPHGLRAVLVEPGFVKTGFGARSTKETLAAVADRGASPYAALHAKWAKRRAGSHGAAPGKVARCIVKACRARRPRIHYYVPLHGKVLNLLKRWLPDAWWTAYFVSRSRTVRR
ncbi:MAG TPA: SDR family oxidoreductase [Candidatus Thermoplasmatota archaeon]|nr:SDR family oxidoreductase [Candidatus Thermoplasmatota archaeon]